MPSGLDGIESSIATRPSTEPYANPAHDIT